MGENMDKRYQVFVSSTFEDLKEERSEIIHALLELNCIPSGMELFPAANEDQWTLIKQVIEDCDYYIVIVGGRYGSIGIDGTSYTEMEYDYAVESGKPVIAFLHENPDNLPVRKVDRETQKSEKLNQFRLKLKEKVCKTWTNAENLGAVVSRSLISLMKTHPAVGWVRGDLIPDEDATKEILNLRREIDELNQRLSEYEKETITDIDNLSKGEDKFDIIYSFSVTRGLLDVYTYEYNSVAVKWNEIFAEIAPLMIAEASEEKLKRRINKFLERELKLKIPDELLRLKEKGTLRLGSFRIIDKSFDSIKVQFRALGLIEKSTKKRSVTDLNAYWILTRTGDLFMTQLMAIKKEEQPL